MSEDDFLTKLYKKDNTPIANVTVNKRTEVREHFDKERPVLKDCTFSQELIFSGKTDSKLDINNGLKFINCTFKRTLRFKDLKDSFHNSPGGLLGSIVFEGCTIKDIEINRCELSQGILFSKNSEIHSFDVQHISLNNSTFHVKDCKISQTFRDSLREYLAQNVIHGLEASDLIFDNVECKEDISFSNLKVQNVKVTNSEFIKQMNLKAVQVRDCFLLENSNFDLFELNIIDNENPDFKGSIGEFKLISSGFDNTFTLNGYSSGNINKIDVSFSSKVKGSLQFNSCCVNDVIFKGENYSSVVIINSDIKSVKFDYLFNYSNITLFDIRARDMYSKIQFSNSDLGKTNLFNIDLDSFSNVVISQCILSEIGTSSVTWFSDEKLSTKSGDVKKSFLHKREIYRQLKQSLTNQSDKISSLQFKKLEKKYYRKELLHNVRCWKAPFDMDRFILLVNQSNDYGLNWFKPVYLSLLTILLFYVFMLPGLSSDLIYWPCFDSECISLTKEEFCRYSILMPQFINPVHNLKSILPNDVNYIGFEVFVLDAFLKIIIAYFIFQTVSAFRKFYRSE